MTGVAPAPQRPYIPRPLCDFPNRKGHRMRAEILSLAEDIKQSLELLRRRL
ncbi:MAG: hypothetical protein R3F55_24880 [Alphaproteobacteria bacterium]